MQIRTISAWLILASTMSSLGYYGETVAPDSTSEVNRAGMLVTPAFQNPIHPKDLSESANPQYTIKSSGRYYVTNDLTVSCGNASNLILLVNASNVSLNLNAHNIVPANSGSLATGTGIAVAAGKSNILIMNGSILSYDSSSTQRLNTGINLSETTVSGGSGTSYSISLQNINMRGCKASGIIGSSINDLLVDNCNAFDGSGSAANYGLNLTTVKNLVVKNCAFDNNTSSGAVCAGVYLTDCIDGVLDNVSASNNSTTDDFDVFGIGLASDSTGCANLKLQSVNCSNNTSSGSSNNVRGLYINSGKSIMVFNSMFNGNNASAAGASGCPVRGIDLVGASNCFVVDCKANGNTVASTNSSTTPNAIGIVVASSSAYNHFENCIASNNSTAANDFAAGFYVTSNNNRFVNCVANHNRNTTTSAYTSAHGLGFYLNGGSYNTLESCQAVGNSTAANAAVIAAGFYINGSTALNKLTRCIANANNASHTSAAVTAAGIYLGSSSSTETRVQFVKCEASDNLVGNGTSSGASARAFGIYFASTANQCIVRDCQIAQNSVGASGSGKAFGFYDNSTSSNSLLLSNVAIGQGSCLNTLNSSLQWNSNSEPSNSQNYFFKHTGTSDDPRTAIHEVPRDNLVSLITAVKLWENISVYDPSGI